MAGNKKPAKPTSEPLRTKGEKREMYLKQIAELKAKTQTPRVKEIIANLEQGLAGLEK